MLMSNQKNKVILVNTKDEWMGVMDKMDAHREGLLHRALSVFILNEHNELLLQKRAATKYHSGGLWSNTCCSHPYPGESTQAAAHRRLQEELGFDCKLKEAFTFSYTSDMGNGLIENEYDHIYTGQYKGEINMNKDEVQDYKYISFDELNTWMKNEPTAFTAWFHLVMPKFIQHLESNQKAA